MVFPTVPDGVEVPNVAAWPVSAGWMLAKPLAGYGHAQKSALLLVAGAVALLLTAAVLAWRRQSYRNWGAKLAIAVWFVVLGLVLADLGRLVWLPVSWDYENLLPGWSNGLALRTGEALGFAYLASLVLTLSANTLRADLFSPLWVLMRGLLFNIILRLSLVVMALRYRGVAAAVIASALGGSENLATKLAILACGLLCLLLAWRLFFASIAGKLAELSGYLWQIAKMRPPPSPPLGAPPPNLDL
jgi:hypothetical protein